jgi:hypothetical protein
MKTTNQNSQGTAVAGQAANPASEEKNPVSVDTVVAEIHIQAHSVGPVLEEILQAGHALVRTTKTDKVLKA